MRAGAGADARAPAHMGATMECVFCREDGGELLWRDDALRVVLATGEHDSRASAG